MEDRDGENIVQQGMSYAIEYQRMDREIIVSFSCVLIFFESLNLRAPYLYRFTFYSCFSEN